MAAITATTVNNVIDGKYDSDSERVKAINKQITAIEKEIKKYNNSIETLSTKGKKTEAKKTKINNYKKKITELEEYQKQLEEARQKITGEDSSNEYATVFYGGGGKLSDGDPDGPMLNLTMKLFGMPYQFTDAVDPRIQGISDVFGKNYARNIVLEAPVLTIIPGEPDFLSGESTDTKITTAETLLKNNSFDSIKSLFGKKDLKKFQRLYDFKNAYTEYMNYVNILCRTCAAFLGLNDESNEDLMLPTNQGEEMVPLVKYDWRQYRWNKLATVPLTSRISDAGTAIIGKLLNNDTDNAKGVRIGDQITNTSEGSIEELLTNYNFVQFFIDSNISPSESMENQTGESSIKSSLVDSSQSVLKEIAFWANSGGISFDTLKGAGEELMSGITDLMATNSLTANLSRILGLAGDVVCGNNLVIPDIYQSSSYGKSVNIDIHLKSPYGTRLGYYLDVVVPMMHLLALVAPRQASSNSYESPFLVKASVPGVFSVNLGIVQNLSFSKVGDSWSVEGFPTEVDVNMTLQDLYSDLTITPSYKPTNFMYNSSLIEYLAVCCGVDVTKPNYEYKYKYIINNAISKFTDIGKNLKSNINEAISNKIADYGALYK